MILASTCMCCLTRSLSRSKHSERTHVHVIFPRALGTVDGVARVESYGWHLCPLVATCAQIVPGGLKLMSFRNKEALKSLRLKGFFGSGGRDRTYDQLINSQLLYR